MKTLLENLGAILVLLGVVCLAVYYFGVQVNGLLAASLTSAGERQRAAFHPTSLGSRGGEQFFWDRDLGKIQNGMTFVTDEVDMGFGVAVEPFYAFHSSHADDHALLFEEGQIPIDRGQRDVRMFLPEHFMNHLCRGMLVCLPQTV